MDFQAQGQEVTKPAFVDRVAQAMVKTALAVMAELEATEGHEQRCQYASRVLASPTSQAQSMARGVVTNSNAGTGTDDPLDDDDALEFVVSSMWSAYAGYYAGLAALSEGAEPMTFSTADIAAKAEKPKVIIEAEPEPEPEVLAESDPDVIDEIAEPTRWGRFKQWWLGSSD